ncbi:aminotransferase class I/II-fold pyridoxal phosphate-dependent enzyme [Corynebacterium bovis]|uniref:MalY/PatB family protein n=1 Tax=Corynebacterium bovis TaxID=36808 RepID=UPI003138C506
MTLSVPDITTLRARGTMKWTAYGPDVLPLWVAETDFDTCPAVLSAVREATDREYLGYPAAGDRSLEEALAAFSADRYGWAVDPAWVVPVPDVVSGIVSVVDALTAPGSTIVVPLPAYPPFQKVPGATRRPASYIPLATDGVDPATGGVRHRLDLEALERAFTATDNPAGVGCLILANPFNPLGHPFSAEELREVTELAARHHVRVISDEIHAPVVLDGAHVPTATVSDTAREVTVTVTATSKGWNTAGLKCAQIIASTAADAAVLTHLGNVVTREPSTLGAVAATAAYTDGVDWLDEEVETLRENVAYLRERLPRVLPGVRLTTLRATFLAWLDLRDVDRLRGADGTVRDPAAVIRRCAGVALNEGTAFGPTGAGCARLNFGTSREILAEALDRVEGADLRA